jgi:hypothetical protein
MTNIKMSAKGKAYLNKGNGAAIVSAIVKRGNNVLSDQGIVVNLDGRSVIVKSAAISVIEAK